MDDELAKDTPKIQADNQSIAIGEINITGTVTGNITIGHTIVQPADARLRHELGILLKNVQTTWIQGVLEKSVHEAALLELGLELREEAVDNPWRMVIEGPDQTQKTLPRGRRIKDIFDEANRLLLILGEPGSGKTTTLLQLARDLIAEVDEAFTQPVPVILNLSTWTNKAQPLDEWLVAELNSKYRLPKKDGQRWLKERRILPLLDGLDEVRAENRAACVEKLNQLVTDYGLQGMAVCSRIKDYTALDIRLAFYRAIYIQPLTPEQVDEYLNEAGEKLASLRATLQHDEALRSMAQSPLILNIMSLAYQNVSAKDLSDPALATDKARRTHLFDIYISRMFNRKAGRSEYDNEQMKRQLSWLAGNMQKHNQEVFLIEGLQPSWLRRRRSQWFYVLISRMIAGLLIGLFIGLFYLLVDVLDVTSGRLITGLIFSIIGALHYWLIAELNQSPVIAALIIGLSIGLPIGIIDVFRFEGLLKQSRMRKLSILWWSVINFTVVWLIVGLILEIELFILAGELIPYPGSGLVAGLFVGLLFGLRGSRQRIEDDIQTVEALHWSWQMALKGGLLIGLLIRLISLLPIGQVLTSNSWQVGGLFGAIFAGLGRKIIDTKFTLNQGIRLSIRNAIFGAVIVGLLFGLIEWLNEKPNLGPYDMILEHPNNALNHGLTTGVFFGALSALWFGGLDVIQHYILRLILLIEGHTPANYSRFLDYAVDRIFLQKVGGGYRFIHRLLLEHFAEMER
ncbi:MAG TPA: NACHT domain-containing protein [Anaerolineales bacterium]|nr:NACHT domain-containing protein [Anaerolineales bacterium]